MYINVKQMDEIEASAEELFACNSTRAWRENDVTQNISGI